ncbi:class I SAM-dependent RNA methyltransferase [Achromobacter sp. GG226]|uniref:THUMP domain-containing protein n=1 Tax=Verticiella alkaliphila TaxID=2779529 RepID=UPI001C0E54B1|nr:class I SAM-dependent RNA methyltransferase [Verticiella sp. GG226]
MTTIVVLVARVARVASVHAPKATDRSIVVPATRTTVFPVARVPRVASGPRPEGDRPFNRGPRDDNDRGPRGPRPDGGFRPRGDDNRPFNRGPRDDNDRGPRSPRSEGGFRPRAPRDDAPGERPTPRHATTPADIYPVFAPCPQGLEAALADELTQLGLTDVQPGRSGVRFRASWLDVMRANLHSRLATRILVQVAHGPIETEDDLLRLAYDTPWERWFGAEQTLRVDTSAIRSPMQSLQYCNLRAKDGICDRLRDREGERPDIDTVRPDARVHVFLDETTATLYLDTSGESLFKRGWRFDKGEAPLRENLAAGLLALSGWKGDTPLVDPFCGSGTILIEAAFIALGVPPGMSRPFSFERLRNHDERVWHSLKADAQRQIRTKIEVPLVGSDIDPRAIDAARQNAERARLGPDTIQFSVAHARDVRPPSDVPGWIVTNPPYGERLETDEDGLWSEWASSLKAHFDGWQVHVITTDRGLPGLLRLNAQRRTPLYNGALECRLFAFEIVGGSYRQKL